MNYKKHRNSSNSKYIYTIKNTKTRIEEEISCGRRITFPKSRSNMRILIERIRQTTVIVKDLVKLFEILKKLFEIFNIEQLQILDATSKLYVQNLHENPIWRRRRMPHSAQYKNSQEITRLGNMKTKRKQNRKCPRAIQGRMYETGPKHNQRRTKVKYKLIS